MIFQRVGDLHRIIHTSFHHIFGLQLVKGDYSWQSEGACNISFRCSQYSEYSDAKHDWITFGTINDFQSDALFTETSGVFQNNWQQDFLQSSCL